MMRARSGHRRRRGARLAQMIDGRVFLKGQGTELYHACIHRMSMYTSSILLRLMYRMDHLEARVRRIYAAPRLCQ